MKGYKRLTLLTMCLLLNTMVFGQTNPNASNFMDSFYESGKIKIVVIGLFVVLAILIFYLIRLDRKITKLEQEHKN